MQPVSVLKSYSNVNANWEAAAVRRVGVSPTVPTNGKLTAKRKLRQVGEKGQTQRGETCGSVKRALSVRIRYPPRRNVFRTKEIERGRGLTGCTN